MTTLPQGLPECINASILKAWPNLHSVLQYPNFPLHPCATVLLTVMILDALLIFGARLQPPLVPGPRLAGSLHTQRPSRGRAQREALLKEIGWGWEGSSQIAVKKPVRAEECLGFAAFTRSGRNGYGRLVSGGLLKSHGGSTKLRSRYMFACRRPPRLSSAAPSKVVIRHEQHFLLTRVA